MRNAVLTFITCITFFKHSDAQKLWTLEECIIYACKHNLEQKITILNSEIDKEIYKQSKRDFLPSFSAVSNVNRRFGRYVDPNNNNILNTATSSNTYGVLASLNLFNNFKKWHERSQRKLLYHAGLANVLQKKYRLAFQVMDAFYLVVFRQVLVEIAKDNLKTSKKNYHLITSKVKLGLLAKADLYEVESQIQTNELEIVKAENNLEEATLSLLQIMNLDTDTIKLKLELDSYGIENKLIVSDIYAKALLFLPNIKSQELYVDASEKQLSIIKSELYPSLSLNAGLRTGYFETSFDENGDITPFLDQLSNNASKTIGVSLRIPLSNRWSKHADINVAKLNIQKEKKVLEQKKQEIYKEIQKTIQKHTSLLVEQEENESNLKSKYLEFTFAQKKFDKGLVTIYQLEQVKNNLAIAKTEKTRINLQLAYQKKALDFYCGIAVFPFE